MHLAGYLKQHISGQLSHTESGKHGNQATNGICFFQGQELVQNFEHNTEFGYFLLVRNIRKVGYQWEESLSFYSSVL